MEIAQSVAPAAGPRSGLARRLVSAPALFAAAAVFLAGGVLLAFLYAPTDSSTMGFSQKIFYFHAPIAETALLAFAIAFVAAIAYLRTQRREVGPARPRLRAPRPAVQRCWSWPPA